MVVHHVGVGLVNGHTFAGEGGRIVNGNSLEVRVLRPVFFEDEEDILGFSEGEDGH